MHVPVHWRLKAQRYALAGTQCPTCLSKHFPPRPVCPVCGAPVQKTIAGQPYIELESPAAIQIIPGRQAFQVRVEKALAV